TVRVQSPILLSPSNADKGLLGVKEPDAAGGPGWHSSSIGVAASSSKVIIRSLLEQPTPPEVVPILSIRTAVVPAGDSRVTIRSPTQVWVISRLTLRSVMSKSSATVMVVDTPAGLLSGIASAGLSEAVSVTVPGAPIQVITGAVTS